MSKLSWTRTGLAMLPVTVLLTACLTTGRQSASKPESPPSTSNPNANRSAHASAPARDQQDRDPGQDFSEGSVPAPDSGPEHDVPLPDPSPSQGGGVPVPDPGPDKSDAAADRDANPISSSPAPGSGLQEPDSAEPSAHIAVDFGVAFDGLKREFRVARGRVWTATTRVGSAWEPTTIKSVRPEVGPPFQLVKDSCTGRTLTAEPRVTCLLEVRFVSDTDGLYRGGVGIYDVAGNSSPEASIEFTIGSSGLGPDPAPVETASSIPSEDGYWRSGKLITTI